MGTRVELPHKRFTVSIVAGIIVKKFDYDHCIECLEHPAAILKPVINLRLHPFEKGDMKMIIDEQLHHILFIPNRAKPRTINTMISPTTMSNITHITFLLKIEINNRTP
ncbi:MAG: hypothetical protein ABI045_04970 [Flavobacteriales bacterium]